MGLLSPSVFTLQFPYMKKLPPSSSPPPLSPKIKEKGGSFDLDLFMYQWGGHRVRLQSKIAWRKEGVRHNKPPITTLLTIVTRCASPTPNQETNFGVFAVACQPGIRFADSGKPQRILNIQNTHQQKHSFFYIPPPSHSSPTFIPPS